MQCIKCGAESASDQKYCGQCGGKLETVAAAMPVPGEDGAWYCARHKSEVTRVRCGRCEKPICTRCAVYGPAGVRCRECARSHVAIRPMGVLHEMGRAGGGVGRTVWYLAVWYFIISLFTGLFGGRHDL